MPSLAVASTRRKASAMAAGSGRKKSRPVLVRGTASQLRRALKMKKASSYKIHKLLAGVRW